MGRHINRERLAQYIEMYNRGMSLNDIGLAVGVTGQTVMETMRRGGAMRRPRPTCPAVVEYKGLRFSPEKDGYLRCTRGAARKAGGTAYLHRMVWEDHHGPIPAQHMICFRDGNRANCAIENLMCVQIGEAQRSRRRMPEPKACAACGTVFSPHTYYYESPSAFAARKTCSYACSRDLLRGVPKGSTRSRRPRRRVRKSPAVDHRARSIVELRARSAHQDPRHHMGLIYREAAKIGRALDGETGEYLGAAYLAMTEAVRTWDARKGYRFSTHACAALKFRTYRSAMEDRGRRRDKDRGWHDPLGTTSMDAGRDGGQIDIAARSVDDGDDHNAAEVRAHRMNELLQLAAEISPKHGAEAIQMLARGVGDKRVGEILGRGPRYVQWLKIRIKMALAGEVA